MVVNRRISVSTAPPLSRTASTQPTVRAPLPPPIPGVHDQSNGPKKERRRSKVTKPKIKRIVSYSGTLQVLLFTLSAVLAYAVAVCRNDLARTLPLCKSLVSYRMQTLDRYVVPPVASVMQIAESYAAPLQPYAASTVDFAQTIIPHIYSFVGSCLFYYDTEVGPRLRRLLVDQLWNSTIKPSYFDILHPTLKRHIYPFYNNYLSPGVRKGTAYAQAAYVRSLPHAKHYLSNAQKNAARISKIVRLHAVNLYVRLRPHITMFLDQVHMLVLVIARKASDLRREFIDPHVRKMLDKVAEKWGPLFG